jgi:hypothetical protein
MLIVSCSSMTHRCLALLPGTCFGHVLQEFPHPAGVERSCGAEGPAESGSAFRQIEAPQVGMQVSTSTWEPPTRIGDENALGRYDS